MSFVHRRRVSFYETDAMGIVHHANFVNYLEDARVAWIHESKLTDNWMKLGVNFAVVKCELQYKRPARFPDHLKTVLQGKREGAKILFRYAIFNDSDDLLALGNTVHVTVDKQMKVCKVPEEFDIALEAKSWTETWPLNL